MAAWCAVPAGVAHRVLLSVNNWLHARVRKFIRYLECRCSWGSRAIYLLHAWPEASLLLRHAMGSSKLLCRDWPELVVVEVIGKWRLDRGTVRSVGEHACVGLCLQEILHA